MNGFNPKMLELARTFRELTQKQLAELLPKINQPNLSKIEKGELNLSQATAQMIADALNYPLSFFYQEELHTPLANIYFRKRATVPQKKLDKIISDVKHILKGIDHFLTDIELPEYLKYSFNLSDGWTPEAAADRMREIYRLSPGPVKDIVTHIEESGIIVYFYDSEEEKFDGLTAYTDAGTPILFVNKNMPHDRMKYTLAHELGHLVMHIPCSIEPWRDFENEANAFASEFLMPHKDCYRDLQNLSYNKLAMLKSYWGVSKAFIIRRAKTIGLITESTYKYLMIELGRRNERKNETGFVDLDEPKVLNEIVNILKREFQYDNQEIADNLRLSIDDYVKLFDSSRNNKFKIRSIKHSI
ncbi:XRE family transcriptional regulator [Mucilaginibacter sp. SMC90]|uniref:helix-turn-helix domain-containing protein n=1 Tax=Mucilaginibacter sp. SMC90 TaxID=2929803 RepID=UPI001FB4CE57|nr:XRE family transcriptional regulator [Mucilaginibacter sp. SMC90]UOE49814.1 XRE family transcriptional regulator [Mucilaginibacter sp. SMC90]